MKIYSQTIELSNPTTQKFWTPGHSDFALGIKVLKNGEETEYVLKKGSETLEPQEAKIGGFDVYEMRSEGEGGEELNVEANGQKVKIQHITTNSTVFDVDAKGEIPSDLSVNSLSAKSVYIVDEMEIKDVLSADSNGLNAVGLSANGEEVKTSLNYPETAKTGLTATLDDNAMNVLDSAVTNVVVPATVNDTVVYVGQDNLTWDFSAWTSVESNDADVMAYTAPALFTFTKTATGKLLAMRTDLQTITA